MNDAIVKRPYRSPLRQAQAEATRQRILDAGLDLFADQGYPATSVAEIARAAGVSTETIYASVGSKRGIVDAWLAQVDLEEVAERAMADIAARGGTPATAIAVLTEMGARFWQEHGRLVGVLRNGMGDPEIGGAWLARQEGRRGAIRSFVAAWPSGSLRAGLTVDRATDIAWALTSDEVYGLFIDLRGWTSQAFVDWARETLIRELLAGSESVASPARRRAVPR
jgi:AcrR family transcriptional regulator